MALDLKELQSLLDTASQADAFKADLKRALRKVGTAVNGLQEALKEVDALMSDDYKPTPKERKPRTPRAPRELGEGEVPAKRGRKPRVAAE